MTPLHYAAAGGHLDVIRLLVGSGADINSPGTKGGTPLQTAAWNKREIAVGLLLDLGAAWNGSKEVAKVVVEHGADLAEDNGGTVLHWAPVNEHIAVAELLVEKGAPLEAVDNEGATPLHRAARNNHHVLVTRIIENGANINSVGHTPLHSATSNEHKEATPALLVGGADPNIQDNMGMVPLHHASVHNHVSAVTVLPEHGTDPKIKDNKVKTALYRAKQSGGKAVMQLLESEPTPTTESSAK